MSMQRPVFEEFEPRILYSADLAPLVLAGLADHAVDAQAASAHDTTPHEIAFVDLSLPDAQALIDDLNAQAHSGRPIEVLTIAAGEDGIARIGAALAERSDVSAVHLLSHGSDGVVQLGSTRLDAASLLARAGELAGWGRALTNDADLLIYGCDVAARPDGRALIGNLAALTGADVAASDDLTGAARLGGDWVLEQQTGRIDTALAISSAEQQQWQATMTLLARDSLGTSGNLDGSNTGTGWANAWSGSTSKIQITGTGLSNPAGDLVGSGGSAKLMISGILSTATAARNLATTVGADGTTTWLAFVVQPDRVGAGDYIGIQFGSSSATTGFAGYNGSSFIVGVAGAVTSTAVSAPAPATGQNALLVVRIQHAAGNDTVTLYVNPTPGLGAPNSAASATATVATMDLGSFTRIAISGGNGSGTNHALIDELRIGQTYADVAPSTTANAPIITSNGSGDGASIGVPENTTAVTTVTASDIDAGSSLVYSISGGADSAKFSINATTGALAFAAAPNFEAPTDAGANNVYDLLVQVSDGTLTDTQAIAVTVNNVNEAPVITSNGGGATAAVSVAENQTTATTLTATDADAATTLSYAITGGTDAAKFNINASTGALSLVTAPDFEAHTDAGANNVYDVTVQASDGSLTDTQALAVTVTNVNEAPVAVSDTYNAIQDQTLTVQASTGLLANDSDPEGSTLGVVSATAPAHGTLSLVPALLSPITNLSNNAGVDTRGDWSPDSAKIAFDSNRDGNNEIYVMNANGSGQTRLTSNGSDDSQAAWSPDGSKIAFMSNRSGSYEVWVMNSDGSGPLQLTSSGSSVSGQPAWSPDGSKIVFTSNRSGAYDLYVMNATGGSATRLTTASGDDAEPVWSPDGTKIVFTSTRDGNSEIYVMNADGSGQTRLTNNGALDRAPVWSRYGTQIAFVSDRSGTAQVYVMDASGANATAVTSEAAGVSFVDWSPDGNQLLFTLGNDIQSARVGGNGAFVYTPTAGYVGPDSFSYSVTDATGLSSTTSVAVTVTPNTAPVIGSNGGGPTASVNVAENSTAVTTVTATDTDLPAQTISYAINGGADAAKFSIDASTGALSFVVAPNYEAPTDVGANNVYNVTVRASDGTLFDTQAIDVTVTNLAEALQSTAEQRVNTTTAGTQETSLKDRGSMGAVAMSAAGDYVVVWSSQNQDGSGWGVYGQRFDKTGAALGAEFLVNQTTANDQHWATVAMDDSGRFVVSWTSANQDGTPESIYARTYAADGTASSAEFRVNTTATGSQFNGTVAMDGSGNFIVVWQGNGPGDPDGLFGRRFGVTGTAIDATEFLINTDTTHTQYDPAVSMNASGAFTVVWDNILGARARRFDSSGTALGAEFAVAAGATAGDAAVAVANDGSTVVVWRETVGDKNVYLRRYDAAGALIGSTAMVNTTTTLDQISPSIAMDGAGNFIVAWEGNGSGDVDGVFARKYDASGTALGAEFLLNATTSGVQNRVSLAMLGLNDFAAAWTGEGPGDTSGVFSRQYGTINVAPVITSNGGGASATLSLAENGTAVTTVTATDLDVAQTLTYAIIGGADAARFTIDVATGVLSFVAAPNFEAPADIGANNVYDLIVRVSDGALTDTQTIAVTVTNANEAPVIGSNGGLATASLSVAENQSAVTTVVASDVDAATSLVYSISGGADSAKFAINASTGVLSFVLAPNFEVPTDAGANNVYDVIVTASDGTLADTQAIAVTVTNVNEAPEITSNGAAATAAIGVAENQTAVTTVTASDADAATTLIYTIAGGADTSKFSIDTASGALAFLVAPNFEAPGDAGANNVYDVIVQVSDGVLTDTQAIAVTVGNVNEAPVITSLGGGASAAVGVAENGTAVGVVVATDPDAAAALSYSISGGADSALFSINASTGALAFVAAPDFEAPGDAGANNVYDVIVRVSDGTLADTQAIAVTVTNVAEAPVITSGGGGTSAAVSVAENQAAVTTFTASDADAGSTLSYLITGGADAAKFNIDAVTGVLRFIAAPDFETPGDAGANNVYDVLVQVSDGALTDTQAIAVTVGNVNEAPVITSHGGGTTAAVSVAEGQLAVGTVTATDVDAATSLFYSIAGGADAAKFSIDAATGALVFVSATSFDTPADAGANNVYDVLVSASDGTLTDTQALAVTVTNVNVAPVITSHGGAATAAITVAENQTAVGTVTATDGDTGTTLTYSITGGADAAKFNIDAVTGVLRFIAAPDFETPGDAGANNVYEVLVQASDSALADTQAIAVTLTNIDEAPVITANSLAIAEGGSAAPVVGASDVDTAAAQLVYTVSGLSGGHFEFTNAAGVAVISFSQADVDAGLLRFVHDGGQAAPAYHLSLSDGTSSTAAQAASIAFTPVNDVPLATPIDLGSIDEDGTRLITTAELLAGASDADGDALSVSGLSLAAGQGSLLDHGDGTWTYTPSADWNGSVVLSYTLSDGTASVANRAQLTVSAVNDAPTITSLGGAASATLSVDENGTAVTTVTASDIDGPAALRYSIGGGADAAAFRIDAASGALSFVVAPDRERPTDANGDNRYEVIVRVSDGALQADQALSIDVANVDEAPTLVTNEIVLHTAESGGGNSLLLVATDPDTPSTALVYQASGEVGGRFERVDAPGTPLSTFTQADVDAGAVRFVQDGSSATPRYALQLSDGVSVSTAAAPTVRTDAPAATLTADDESANLVNLPAPAAAVSVPAPAPAQLVQAPSAAPAPAAAAKPQPTVVATTDAQAHADLPATSADGPAQRGFTAVSADTRGVTRSFDITIDPVLWQINLPMEFDAGNGIAPGADTGIETSNLDLASALRERSLTQALEPLRHEAELAQGAGTQIVVGGSAVSAGLSVGYVLWLARGGVLMASVMSALPAWASLDPLPVLGQVKGKNPGKAGFGAAGKDDENDEDDQDAVEQLFSKAPAKGVTPQATLTSASAASNEAPA